MSVAPARKVFMCWTSYKNAIRTYSDGHSPAYHAKFVDANDGTILEAVGADNEQKQSLSASSATNNMLANSLASCIKVAICNIS